MSNRTYPAQSRSLPICVTVALLVGVFVACLALPVQADAPRYHPGGPNPGLYAARDFANLDPETYHLDGAHQTFYWDDLEPQEGVYDWSGIDAFLAREEAKGQKAAICLITFNGRANEGNASDPPIRVPDWVLTAGATVVTCSDGFEIPEYWNAVYQAKHAAFAQALANRYDGDPRLAFVIYPVGKFGETQPCDDGDDAYVSAAMTADGLHPEWGDWATVVNDITAIYADAFGETQLLLASAPRFVSEGERQIFGQYAVSRGVGLFPAGVVAVQAYVDLRTKPNSYGKGMYDLILEQAETVDGGPNAHEMYDYMTPGPVTVFWGVVGALARRPAWLTLDKTVLYTGPVSGPRVPMDDNLAIFDWAGDYVGRGIAETPSVWVALRESGYVDSYYPQLGNHSWYLAQDHEAPNAQTVLATWRSAEELVLPGAYMATGGACARSGIETDQPLVEGSREGWICRRTDQATGNPLMAFDIDDRYAFQGPSAITITVTYLDRGTDAWQLRYDGASDADSVAATIHKGDSGQWLTASFALDDAWLANRQSGSVDLTIDCMDDGDEYIHFVDVSRPSGLLLRPGWHLLSLPVSPASSSISDVLASLHGQYDAVYAQGSAGDSTSWSRYVPSAPGYASTLDELGEADGFWVHMVETGVWQVAGADLAPGQVSLAEGWNLIGYPSYRPLPVDEALASIAGDYDLVYGYDKLADNGPWLIYDVNADPAENTLSELSAGWGYWVHATGDCVWNTP